MKKILFLSLILAFFSHSTFAQDNEFLEEFESEYHININDPFENYNRFMTDVNWGIYDYVFNPLLEGYTTITPVGFRIGVYNFFDNLAFPLRFLSHLFSFEFEESMNEFARFALNSTFGLGGIFDIATPNGLYSKRSDFGITFGNWGMESGFHFVLPLLGPSNLRDILAKPFNALAYPTSYLDPFLLSAGVYTFKEFNYTARHKGLIESFRRDGLDTYTLMRDSYEQRRNGLIKE